jgi:hypothetical protein
MTWKPWAALAAIVVLPALAGPKAPIVCAESTTNCASMLAAAGTPVAAKKFNPGHYLLPYLGETQAGLLARADEVCRESALKGMQVRASWPSLEVSKGNYTFGNIEQLYGRLAACKKRLVLEVWAVSFDETVTAIVPSDLAASIAPTNKGYIAKLWDPAVMDRFIALYTALAKRFESEPYFEGIVFTETATGGVGGGYTAPAYIAQLTRGIKAIRAAWPTSSVIVYDNYIMNGTTQQQIDFMKMLLTVGVYFGGPDVLPPPAESTTGEEIYRGEVGGVDYRGRMRSGFSVQAPELGGTKGAFTPQQLFDHCAKTNKCRYMFWMRNTETGGPEQQWSTGILPFLRANPSL